MKKSTIYFREKMLLLLYMEFFFLVIFLGPLIIMFEFD